MSAPVKRSHRRNGGGTLTVYTETGAAAIGGSQGEGAGTIIINGGTINASTGYDGAGIGGGQYGTAPDR